MRYFLQMITMISVLLAQTALHAQRPSRANGIGVRASYWNLGEQATRFNISETKSTFDVSGVGGWLYYFSRLNNNWSLDFEIGGFVRVRGEENLISGTEVDVSVVAPILAGVRYDLLPVQNNSAAQPYLSAGLGPYLTTSFEVRDQGTGETVTGGGRNLFGAYAGGGLNLVMRSWAAFNFDLRYHFVDLKSSRGLAGLHHSSEYSGLEFGLGLCFMWGSKRELFQIKETKLVVRDLYPAYYNFYSTYPLALVTIKNTAGFPIEVNVQSNIRGYSERPKDSGFIRLEKNQTKDIPVTAILSPKLQAVARREPAILDIRAEARAGGNVRKETSAQIMVHSRNAWNGEVDKLSFFVTPEDERILNLNRRVLREMAEQEAVNVSVFDKAKALFAALGEAGLRYQSDPNIPYYQDDRVQFAAETLDLRAGDCDDLVILCASLFESAGIRTAFVEVRDPEKEIAHLYLLFDSGLPASRTAALSSNEKRYVMREKSAGPATAWIPLETTLVASGFEEAWKSGALQYLEEGILRNGLADGWVKIVEVK